VAKSAVSKTVNPGSNPGSPATRAPAQTAQLTSASMARARTAPAGRRIGAGALLAGVTLMTSLALAAGPGATAALAGCPHATDRPHQTSLAKLGKAMRCLVNNKRAKHGLRRLKDNDRLQTAARKHTNTMLRKDCFEHRCAGEPSLGKRVKRTGYTKGANAYFYAEDLGYHKSPKRTIRKLMRDRFNRRNILNRDWEDIGVAAGWGTPVARKPDRRFMTFTIVFAWRRP
jgi:uncharacterized protein YkwD